MSTDSTISQLPTAGSLTGTEVIPIVQGGITKQTPAGLVFSSPLFTQTGTGAIARSPNSKWGDIVSVKDFGAKGDGVTDDTAAFNAAILDCVNNGFALYVPGGTYLLSALNAVTLKNFLIFGDGKSSILKFNTTGKGFQFGPNGSQTQRYNLTMRDLSFTNITNTPAAYISQENYVNALFERLYFSDCAATYCIDNVVGYGTTVRSCVFSDVTGTPIRLRDNGAAPDFSYEFKIEDCDITRPSSNGIEVEAANGLKISGTVIESCGGWGLITSTNVSGLSVGILIDTCDFESNTSGHIKLQTDGSSYWGRAVVSATNFVAGTGVHKIDIGAKSRITFIGIQANSGLTVSGSSLAETYLIGCEAANFTQSGTFTWRDIGNDASNVVTYVPVWSSSGGANTLGNGTITGTYARLGNLVRVKIKFVFGSTSSVTAGVQQWSLPFASAATEKEWGIGNFLDAGATNFAAIVSVSPGASIIQGTALDASATPQNITETSPTVWATGDSLECSISYICA